MTKNLIEVGFGCVGEHYARAGMITILLIDM